MSSRSPDQAKPTSDQPESLEAGALRHANVSKIFRFLGARTGEYGWERVKRADYKPSDDSWRGVSRRVLVGETGESPRFHMRYFEIVRGGYTTLEQHQHEHAVMVLRGRGQVQIGCEQRSLGFGDVVYVAPGAAHQFRNDDHDEPFGFVCVVNAERDRPREAEAGFCQICE